MGFYQDNKIVADSEVIGVAGSTGVTAARDEAVALGGTGNKNIIGADASGENNTVNSGTLSGNKDSTITVGYDAGQFQTALQTVGSNLTNALSAQSAAGSETLENVLGKLTDLAESKQTDGESGKNQIVLYVVLAVLAVVAWIFYRK